MTTVPFPHTLRALATLRFSLGRLNLRSESREMSLEKYLQEPFANAQEAHTYRQFFAARWRDFVRSNFTSPAHVAVCFGVTAVTAQNWWDGMNAPQGWAVAKAMTDPATALEAAKHLSGESSGPHLQTDSRR